jgi:hypothetical protein
MWNPKRKASCVSDQYLRDPGKDRRGHLKDATADRAVLPMDQAAPAGQVVLWHIGQRRQNPDLGRSLHLLARGHHEKVVESLRQSPHPVQDPRGQYLREKVHPANVQDAMKQNMEPEISNQINLFNP